MYQKNAKGWLKHWDFILLDIITVHTAFALAFQLRHGLVNPYARSEYHTIAIVAMLADIVAIIFISTYEGVLRRGYYKEFVSSFKNGFVMMALVLMYVFVIKEGETYSRITLSLMGVLYVVLTFLVRSLWKGHLHRAMAKGAGKRLLVVTTVKLAEEVLSELKNNNYHRYNICGIILVDGYAVGSAIDGVPVVADMKGATEYVRTAWLDEIYVDVKGAYGYVKPLIDTFVEAGITVHLCISSLIKTAGGKQIVQKLNGQTVVTTTMNYATPRQMFMKRAMDVAGGFVGSVFTIILTIFIGPLIYIKSPGPIFFKQERVGLNGKIIKIYKFRSMYMDAEERKKELMAQNTMGDSKMFKLDFDPRVIGNEIMPDGTKKKGIGQFIRDFSIDEFPQFFNVLKGDLSLVGTRPPLISEVEQYDMHHKSRLATKPGITGMWQVSGRSDITDFEEVVRLDNEYIENWSFGLDIKILLKTVKVVLFREGSK